MNRRKFVKDLVSTVMLSGFGCMNWVHHSSGPTVARSTIPLQEWLTYSARSPKSLLGKNLISKKTSEIFVISGVTSRSILVGKNGRSLRTLRGQTRELLKVESLSDVEAMKGWLICTA